MSRLISILIIVCASIARTVPAEEPKPQEKAAPATTKSSRLPHVLLIGNKVSLGYLPEVAMLLGGKAEVEHAFGDNGTSHHGVNRIDKWVGDTQWDVVYFNFGMEDLVNARDGKPFPRGHQIGPVEYEKNLREIVAKLKMTHAKLIWASTTPIPEGWKLGRKGDEVHYNNIAKKVMEENDIAVDDLYAFVLPKAVELQKQHGVLFTKEGNQVLGKQVAATIEKAIAR